MQIKRRPPKIVQLSLTMPQAQIVALEKLACRIRDGGGKKLAVNAILRALVRLYLEMGIDPVGIKNEDELLALIQKKIKRVGGGK